MGQKRFYLKAKIAPASFLLFWGLLSFPSCPYNPHCPQRAGHSVCRWLMSPVPCSLTDQGTVAHTALNQEGSANWEPYIDSSLPPPSKTAVPQAQHWHCSPLPCVDLQGGLQELGTLLLGLGQLLHAKEVSGSPHLEHGDHGRVGVQPCRLLGQKQQSVLRGQCTGVRGDRCSRTQGLLSTDPHQPPHMIHPNPTGAGGSRNQ